MNLEQWKVTDLQPDPQNARKHNQANLQAIARSLEQFGQRKPIVVTAEGVVLAGNGTVEAAKTLGWKELQVTIAPAEWDYNTARAYALADNRTGELASWDNDALLETLKELPAVLVESTGFDPLQKLSEQIKQAPTLPTAPPIAVGEREALVRVSFLVPQASADRWWQAVKMAGAGGGIENLCTAIEAAYDAVISE